MSCRPQRARVVRNKRRSFGSAVTQKCGTMCVTGGRRRQRGVETYATSIGEHDAGWIVWNALMDSVLSSKPPGVRPRLSTRRSRQCVH